MPFVALAKKGCRPVYAMTAFFGRPPLRPFSRDSAILATVRARPPAAPSSRAIQIFGRSACQPFRQTRREGKLDAGIKGDNDARSTTVVAG